MWMLYLDLDEDVGEGVGERDVAEGLQRVPDLLRGVHAGAEADAGETALEPTVGCNNSFYRFTACTSV
jgi:hypothetical protein